MSATEQSASSGDAGSTLILRRLQERGVSAARYRVAGEVARGGMGVILRVWDDDLRRPLAMKVTLANVADGATTATQESADARMLARFLEEAQVTGQLEHPGIVPVHELGVDAQGRAYFTMRLVRGRDLEQIFELVETGAEGWTRTRALNVVLRVCEAMAFAHDRKVLHRDLKPANVMVGPFGEVYVMDWGLARVQGQADLHDLRLRDAHEPVATDRRDRAGESKPELYTMDGDVVGTPSYMSPEQARGELDELDARSDVYAVGAILYRLLGGVAPYTARGVRAHAMQVVRDLLAGPPAPLDAKARAIPAELAAIVDKAMARNRAQRYATMSAFADDLRAFLENRVVAAYETGAWAEARKWMRRNRGLAAALTLALLVLVMGLVASLSLKARADTQSALAETRRKAADASAAQAEKEAAVARAINGFLNDDVLASIASEQAGVDVSMREVLASASSALDGRFGDEPEVEAALRMTIGQSLERIGEYAAAARHFARAEELRGELDGADSDPTFEARLLRAGALANAGEAQEAEDLLLALIDSCTRRFGPEHRAVLTARSDLALYYQRRGRRADARAMFEALLPLQDHLLGHEHTDAITTRMNFGNLLAEEGELERADALLTRALADFRSTLGENDPRTMDAISGLAELRHHQGRFEEGERLAREGVERRAARYGEDHAITARALSTLAQLKADRGRDAEALADFERSYEVLSEKLGDEHPWTLRALNNLSSQLATMGQLDRALPLREKALAGQRRVLGAEHPDTLLSTCNLAQLYASLGRQDDAERLGKETLALQERVLGPDHPSTLVTRENLGGVYYHRRQYDAALPLVREVLAGRTRALGANHPAVTRTMFNLAMVEAASGDAAVAEPRFAEALRRMRVEFPDGNAMTATCLVQLADLRSAAQDHEAAQAYLREALASFRALQGDGARETTSVMHQLGVSLVHAGKYPEAARQLREALDLRLRTLGDDDQSTLATSYTLSGALLQLGEYEHAEELLLDFARREEAQLGIEHETTQLGIKRLVDLYEKWQRPQQRAEWSAKLH